MTDPIKEACKNAGVLPIELGSSTTILLDINLLPKEYKELGDLETTLKAYENRFNVKVIPIDTTRRNLQGDQPIVAQIIK